jgi:ParB family chromosome partitioning protein
MANTPANDPKRRALGRGLESLLPQKPSASPVPAEPTGKAFEISVELIDRNPYQTRTTFDEAKLAELAGSIATSGVVQPILVRPGKDGRFTLITGERRWLAAQKAGLKTIPAVVREVSNEQAMEITIVENLQREDLNPMEQARAYHRLSTEFRLTQEQMATRTGKDRTSVANFLRLLKLPENLQQHVETGELTHGHARALLALDRPEDIASVGQKALALSLSVRALETMVYSMLHPDEKKRGPKPKPAVDPNVQDAQDQLRRSLGLKVTIEDKKGKGKVIIEYSGVEDFDAILTALGNEAK